MRPIKERVTEYEVGYQFVYHYQLRNQSKCVTHMAAQGLMCDNDVMVTHRVLLCLVSIVS